MVPDNRGVGVRFRMVQPGEVLLAVCGAVRVRVRALAVGEGAGELFPSPRRGYRNVQRHSSYPGSGILVSFR